MKASTIKRAVALAEHIPPAEIQRLSRRLALVSTQVETGSALLDSLLGVEEASKPRVENSLAVLKREQTELQNRVTFGAKYHLLSMEPLTWRDKNGWPRLVVFALDSLDFGIDSDGNISPELPEPIQNKFDDVIRKLKAHENRSRSGDTVELACTFEGLIPKDVKNKITAAEEDFDNDIYVIAEPTNLSVRRIARTRPGDDPLVVGFKHGTLWLIADFETTPVEEAMKFSLIGKANKN